MTNNNCLNNDNININNDNSSGIMDDDNDPMAFVVGNVGSNVFDDSHDDVVDNDADDMFSNSSINEMILSDYNGNDYGNYNDYIPTLTNTDSFAPAVTIPAVTANNRSSSSNTNTNNNTNNTIHNSYDDEHSNNFNISNNVFNIKPTPEVIVSESAAYNDDNSNPEYTHYTETTSTATATTTSQTIDELLAKELNSLSFQARETINEEIHGINVNQIYFDKIKEIEETPELLKESFSKLQTELNKLQPTSFAYQRCQQLYGDNNNATNTITDGGNVIVGKRDDGNTDGSRKSSYINTNEFRIMFLRCELFDAPKAARRLINFVELMYELYGDIGLQRRIRMDDLSNYEVGILQAGYTQILSGRDRADRRTMFFAAYNSTNEYTVKSRLRVSFYIQMNLAEDIETQRKGVILITWYHNVNIFDDFKIRGETHARGIICIPVRIGAIHICIPEEFEDNNYSSLDDNSMSPSSLGDTTTTATPANIIKSMLALSIGAKLRPKLRFHSGKV